LLPSGDGAGDGAEGGSKLFCDPADVKDDGAWVCVKRVVLDTISGRCHVHQSNSNRKDHTSNDDANSASDPGDKGKGKGKGKDKDSDSDDPQGALASVADQDGAEVDNFEDEDSDLDGIASGGDENDEDNDKCKGKNHCGKCKRSYVLSKDVGWVEIGKMRSYVLKELGVKVLPANVVAKRIRVITKKDGNIIIDHGEKKCDLIVSDQKVRKGKFKPHIRLLVKPPFKLELNEMYSSKFVDKDMSKKLFSDPNKKNRCKMKKGFHILFEANGLVPTEEWKK
jgi:hypothetical protein